MKQLGLTTLFCITLFIQSLSAQEVNRRQHWVDSVYQSLPLEKKIAQLFMAVAHVESNLAYIENMVDTLGIGGLCFMQGKPTEQVAIINKLQKRVKVPLWFSMDAEWGVGMRLPLVQDLPKALTLGAVRDTSIAYEVGRVMGAQLHRMGFQINYAPVLDINSNPDNVVINYRSFGENKQRVAQAAAAIMRGMQSQGIIACAKHFPGHGNTSADSHVSLPVINQSKKEMEETEMYPYKQLIAQGLKGVMTAHLQIPSLDNTPNMPASLSPTIIQGVLQQQLGFKGLIFTDGLNMQSVLNLHSGATLDYLSFLAGNDVLLFSRYTSAGIDTIRRAYLKGIITEERLAHSVKKILSAKYDAGLWKRTTIDTLHLLDDLNAGVRALQQKIAAQSITCVRDNHDIIEAVRNGKMKEVCLVLLNPQHSLFQDSLIKLGIEDIVQINPSNAAKTKKDLELLRTKQKVIVCVTAMTQSPVKQFGLDSIRVKVIDELSTFPNTMIVFFGNPYVLRYCCNAQGALVTYDDSEDSQRNAVKVFTGELNPIGLLPVSPCKSIPEGSSYTHTRWKPTKPSE